MQNDVDNTDMYKIDPVRGIPKTYKDVIRRYWPIVGMSLGMLK